MMSRTALMSCVVAVVTTLPAQADIILGYRISSFVPTVVGTQYPLATQIPGNLPLGSPIAANSIMNPLQFMPGETKFIQITIAANAASPVPANQLLWDAGNGFTKFDIVFNYSWPLVSQPYASPIGWTILTNTPNANTQVPYQVNFSNWFPNYNVGQTAITGSELAFGIEAAGGIQPETVIATFKVVAGMTPGNGVISLTDLNGSATNFQLSDGTNLDPIIFSAAHNNFPLYISVVPEPSSLALVGLAVLAIWKQRWPTAACG